MSALEAKAVAVVTGASHGIGRAVAIMLARRHMHVVLVARNQHELEDTLVRVQAQQGSGEVCIADISTAAGVEKISETTPRLSVLVHCAATTPDPQRDSVLKDTPEDILNSTISTIVLGTLKVTRALEAALEAGQPSNVIFVVSDWALRGSHGPPIFSAAKAAVGQFAHTIRRQFAEKKISVTAIYPGDVASFDKDWQEAKWDLDDDIANVEGELGTSRIALRDIVETIMFSIDRKLARVEEIHLAPLSGEYDY